MKNEIIIRSYIPHVHPYLAKEINQQHKNTLQLFKFDVPSNNEDWINKKNVIGFYAEHVNTKKYSVHIGTSLFLKKTKY